MQHKDSNNAGTKSEPPVTAGGFKPSFVQWLTHPIARNILVATLVILALAVALLVGRLHASKTPLELAISYIKANQAAKALPILEQLSLQHPVNPLVFPWLAHGYLTCDRIAEGRIALDTALRMGLPSQDLLPAVLYYTDFYERRGDFEEAEKLFISAGGACPAQLLDESKSKFYFDWAEAEDKQNHLKEAAAHLEAAYNLAIEYEKFKTAPATVGTQTPNWLKTALIFKLSDVYSRLAVLAQGQDKNDAEAISYLEKSLKINDVPATRLILANIYNQDKLYVQAIANYQLVAQADKNNLECRHHLIDILLETRDYDSAQKALVELCDKEKSVENYQQLANADINLNNYAGAVHALEDASELGRKPDVLKQLLSVLNDWYAALTKEKKVQEANSVKGHADRVAELLDTVIKEEEAAEQEKQAKTEGAKTLPIALSSSRTWLMHGSVTPEGEIKIKNISGKPVRDLTLNVVFYDNTARRANGGVTLPVAVPNSSPFAANEERTLYFSCPTIIKADHKLAVLLFWQGRFLQEFPVVKQ